MQYTRGFVDHADLMEHYNDHVLEFGMIAIGPNEYQDRADEFVGSPTTHADVLTFVRSKGDRVRFNPKTAEFGILSVDGFIRTYFKADPKKHKMPTNMGYFRWACGRY